MFGNDVLTLVIRHEIQIILALKDHYKFGVEFPENWKLRNIQGF